jgi:hypothetical protein
MCEEYVGRAVEEKMSAGRRWTGNSKGNNGVLRGESPRDIFLPRITYGMTQD